MTPYENAIWHCDIMECLERLPSQSKDLIIDSAWGPGLPPSNEDGYQEALYRKIQQLKRVLSNKGVVFVEGGTENLGSVRKFMEEVFTKKCFVKEFIIPTDFYISSGENQYEQPNYSTLVGYSRQPGFSVGPMKITDAELSMYHKYTDEKGRYRKELMSFGANLINTKFKWRGYLPPGRGSWMYLEEKMERLFLNGEVDVTGTEPMRKIYLPEEKQYRTAPVLWDDLDWVQERNKARYKPYHERLLVMTATDGCRVLELSSLGGNVMDACIDFGYPYLSLEAVCDKRKVQEENYRGVVQKVERTEVDKISCQLFRYKRLEISKEDKIANLILVGETQKVEFKKSAAYNHDTGKKDKELITNIIKVIVAFANTKTGGTLLIGVTDDGNLVDLRKEEYKAANPQKNDKDGYCLYLNDCIGTRTSKLVLSLCSIEILTIDDADLCVIEVKPAERPVFYKGTYYRRQGTQDQEFTTEEFYERMMLEEMGYGADRRSIS